MGKRIPIEKTKLWQCGNFNVSEPVNIHRPTFLFVKFIVLISELSRILQFAVVNICGFPSDKDYKNKMLAQGIKTP